MNLDSVAVDLFDLRKSHNLCELLLTHFTLNTTVVQFMLRLKRGHVTYGKLPVLFLVFSRCSI